MSDVARLAVPLGLILSRTGLEKLMARRRRGTGTIANNSPVAPSIKRKSRVMTSPGRKASLSGGSAIPSVKRIISPVKLGSKVKTAVKITTPEIKAKSHAKTLSKTKVKVANKQSSSPVKRVVTTSASSTATRNTRIRKHFQEIAKKVQEIFAKARTDKLKKSAKAKPSHGR